MRPTKRGDPMMTQDIPNLAPGTRVMTMPLYGPPMLIHCTVVRRLASMDNQGLYLLRRCPGWMDIVRDASEIELEVVNET